jgi:DNA-binding beta-propeller fold protein YncE
MKKQNFFKLNKLYALMMLFSVHNVFAANFNITPYGTLPTTVTTGQTVPAYFTVTNMTNTARNGYFIQGLPATVTQNTTSPNCSNPINLVANTSCQLRLDITGAVSASFAICKGNSCTTATTPLNVSVSSAPPSPRYAYVANYSNSTVSACPIITGGLFGDCVSSGNTGVAFDNSFGVTLNNTGTFAYVSNYGDSKVLVCPIITGGLFGDCVDSGNTGVTFNQPSNITLNAAGTIAYVSNEGAGDVYVCPIISGGLFGDCVASGNTGVSFTTPAGITLNSAGTIAYVGNNSGSTVSICPIITGGLFGDCVASGNTGVAFAQPTGVILNSAGTQAYVTNSFNNAVSVCPIISGGLFGDCINSGNTGVAFDYPGYLALG